MDAAQKERREREIAEILMRFRASPSGQNAKKRESLESLMYPFQRSADGSPAICSEVTGPESSMAERSAKIAAYHRSQGVSKVCQLSGCPWSCSASASICSQSGTAVSVSCGGSIRLGLMVLREFIGTIYHEMEIHESGAFERGKR